MLSAAFWASWQVRTPSTESRIVYRVGRLLRRQKGKLNSWQVRRTHAPTNAMRSETPLVALRILLKSARRALNPGVRVDRRGRRRGEIDGQRRHDDLAGASQVAQQTFARLFHNDSYDGHVVSY